MDTDIHIHLLCITTTIISAVVLLIFLPLFEWTTKYICMYKYKYTMHAWNMNWIRRDIIRTKSESIINVTPYIYLCVCLSVSQMKYPIVLVRCFALFWLGESASQSQIRIPIFWLRLAFFNAVLLCFVTYNASASSKFTAPKLQFRLPMFWCSH